MTQEFALSVLRSGRNVFLTGSAGTGKTYVLNQFIKHLKQAKLKVAITASTGIAATHIQGVTIHSWSGIGIKQKLSSKDLSNIKKKGVLSKEIDKIKVLIIDEISMLHKDQLDAVHQVLSFLKNDTRPFGGIQVVLCGDFFQLPPIGKPGETSRDRFAFMSSSWLYADFQICYLTKQYRQSNNKLATILDEIRTAKVSAQSIKTLQEAAATQFSKKTEPTLLYTHNVDVDRLNQERLESIPGLARKYRAKTKGEKQVLESLKKAMMTPNLLELKIGAKVMFVKNNPDKGVVNGTIGEIIDYSENHMPLVQTFDGDIIEATREDWQIEDEAGKTIATYSQIPLRLAWAITVHKSQGMTLDAAILDLGKTFEKGQGYVALSRLRSIENLQLMNFNTRSLEVDRLAFKADTRFKELSQELMAKVSEGQLSEEEKNFVKNSGGRNLRKIGERKA